jgi:putative hemin transport protein
MAEGDDRADGPLPVSPSAEELAYSRGMAKLPFREKLLWLEEVGRMLRFNREGPSAGEAWPEPSIVVENSMSGTTISQVSAAGVTPEQAGQIRDAVRNSPSQMTLQLARQLGVPEVEVIRALPDGRAVELDVGRWEELIHALEGLGQVHVIVSNSSVTCEVNGQFGGFSTWGEFFNVQSKSLDLHVRTAELAAAFAVEKPGHVDGVNTLSVQFYDRSGGAAFKVFLTFGGQKPSLERAAQFAALRERFRKA